MLNPIGGVRCRLLAVAVALAVGLGAGPARAETRLLVFAAASLKNALDDAIVAYGKTDPTAIVPSYAASGPLAKQIETGAPADLFISADLQWMDYLAERKLIDTATRVTLLGNSLVLVAPTDSKASITLAKHADLAGLLGGDRLAIGDPQSVPAGKYAQQALTSLEIWPSVADHLAKAENVRAALFLVARKEAPLGIVYGSDAHADPSVRVVATFPADSHPPIVYPAAIPSGSTNPEGAKFLHWLASPAAAPFFQKQGFTIAR